MVNFSLLDNQDQFGNQYYPSDDRAVIITKEIWDEMLRSLLGNVTTFTTTATLTRFQNVALCDMSGGSYTLTLPPAADVEDLWVFRIKKTTTDLNILTVTGDGAETIDGNSNILLTLPYQSIDVASDGTAWYIL